jgi:hypothetical protein
VAGGGIDDDHGILLARHASAPATMTATAIPASHIGRAYPAAITHQGCDDGAGSSHGGVQQPLT